MPTTPEDKVPVMAMRAAANQLGYVLGAAAGGLALALAGVTGLGVAPRRCSPPRSSPVRLPRPAALRAPSPCEATT